MPIVRHIRAQDVRVRSSTTTTTTTAKYRRNDLHDDIVVVRVGGDGAGFDVRPR
jgi:hypothetical protein